MRDGPQVRQQLDNVHRVPTTRAWRCLLLLGATGMLAVACSLHWRYSCVLLHASVTRMVLPAAGRGSVVTL